jgi:UDP-N-acetylglucosamine 2-epimerase (non-hydrolysing)
MSSQKKIAVIFGTRPDTIKLAPIILALKRERCFSVVTIATAQHRQMLDQVLKVFDIHPDHDLNSMKPRQTLAEITRNTIDGIDHVLEDERPDMVLVQGDTTTTFVGSLAAFYRHIPVGHVEAGLRTNNKAHPFPEEINRRLTSCIADLNFAPTETAKKALLREHTIPSSIVVTGNSVIDALRIAVRKKYKFSVPILSTAVEHGKRMVLITLHRRENWGAPMEGAARAIKRLAERYDDVNFIFPVHLNPAVRDIVFPILQHIPNVFLIEPLDYLDFVNLMARSYLILTDSGGVQEEGPALGKPVLVLREVTERPEAVEYGTVKLVGLDEERIFNTARKLLDNRKAYTAMATATNPYGDGFAARRTVHALKHHFGYSKTEVKEFRPS